MTRHDLLRKLVTTGHLNVSERAQLGNAVVRRVELFAAIREVLTESRYFPPHARPWRPGETCYEGRIIERTGDGTGRLHCQRPLATDPRQLAETTCTDFETVANAIDAYLEHEIGAAIDGISVT